MKTYEGTTSVPVTLNFTIDLGGPARPAGVIQNLGDAELQVVMTLGTNSTAPLVLPPGARYLTPCALNSLTISPIEGEITYQVAVDS